MNFKRVVDGSATVLRGSSDIVALGHKVLAELAKHKDVRVVKTKTDTFVQHDEELLGRFTKAMAIERKRYNATKLRKALVAQDDPNSECR